MGLRLGDLDRVSQAICKRKVAQHIDADPAVTGKMTPYKSRVRTPPNHQLGLRKMQMHFRLCPRVPVSPLTCVLAQRPTIFYPFYSRTPHSFTSDSLCWAGGFSILYYPHHLFAFWEHCLKSRPCCHLSVQDSLKESGTSYSGPEGCMEER